ncbi:MAG: toprim domain-containing protein, partial [Chloroflexi bacterium]|nr:toprim domain-containing protein [Chloroflexota bacterium]
QAGFTNVVASLGTALTEKQLGLLKRLTNRYALALDPDAAGEQATIRGLQVARQALGRKSEPVPMGAGLIGFEQRLEAELLVISMPPGKDPDELIHDDPSRWTELVGAAEPLVDFNFRVLTQELDLPAARDKSVAVKRLVPIIREIGDPVQRAHYAQRLARLVQVPDQTIAQQISARPIQRSAPGSASSEESADDALPRGEQVLEEYCLMLALRSPEYLPQIDFLEQGDYADPSIRALFFALVEAQRQAGEAFQVESLRETLDPALVPLFDHLIARARLEPVLDEPESARDIQTAAYRLRLQRDRAELAQVEVLQRDEEDEQSTQDRASLRERVEFLRKRINFSQKALNARTLFKPHSYGVGFG